MIINSIKLKNYGIYYKENVYDFSIENENQNIILINGKNGSGKTTLLEAIKKCIYGSVFYGLKNPNKNYYNIIEKKFNIKAFNEGEREAFIELDFQWKENNNIDNYKIKRIWKLKENEENNIEINEKVEIIKNNIYLSAREIEDVENYFRTIFPQKIFDFFFFDGEEVKKLISAEYIEKELKEAVYTLFDIDIFKSLNSNLSSYLKNRSKNNKLTEEEKVLEEKEEEIKSLKIEISEKNGKKLNLIDKEDNIENQIKILNERFKNTGGELYDKRSIIERKLLELDYQKTKNTETLKNYLANEIPLMLNYDLLLKSQIQLEKEKGLREYKFLYKTLEEGSLREILKENFLYKINNNDIDRFSKNIKNKLDESKTKDLHNLNYENVAKVNKEIKKLEKMSAKIKLVLDLRKENNEKIVILKSDLNKIKNNYEIEEILKEITIKNRTLSEIKNDKIQLYKEIESLTVKEFELDKEIKELKHKIITGRKEENKFNVVYKIQNVLNKFIYDKNIEKMDLVKKYFIESFNSLHRKQGFIESVEINPETLELKLYSKYGEIKNHLLSAGEKQIYILSLLLAFLKVSKKEIPLIFDTLLGRLDEEHRGNIITRYLPNASKQVLILSTDSEVAGENYRLIKPYIAKEYTINYNIESQTIDIVKHKGEINDF